MCVVRAQCSTTGRKAVHVMFLMSRRATDGVCTHRYHVGRACPAPAGSCSRTSICRDTAPAESVARWMSGADEDSRSRSRHHRAVKSARVAEGAADWPPARRRRCTTHCDVFLGPVRRGARPGRREGRRRASRGPCGVITSTRHVLERTRERGAARVPRLARHALLPCGRGGRARAPPSATGAPGEGVQGDHRSGAVDICLVIIS